MPASLPPSFGRSSFNRCQKAVASHTQTHLWPGTCAPGCTLSHVAGLTAARLLCKGHTLSVVHDPLRALAIKCHAVNGASLGASTTGSWAGSPLPRCPPARHRMEQTNNSPAKLPRGTREVSVTSLLQSDKENLFAEESQRQAPISPSAAQLNWQCRVVTPETNPQLLSTCYFGIAQLSMRGKISLHGFWSPDICKNIMSGMEHQRERKKKNTNKQKENNPDQLKEKQSTAV